MLRCTQHNRKQGLHQLLICPIVPKPHGLINEAEQLVSPFGGLWKAVMKTLSSDHSVWEHHRIFHVQAPAPQWVVLRHIQLKQQVTALRPSLLLNSISFWKRRGAYGEGKFSCFLGSCYLCTALPSEGTSRYQLISFSSVIAISSRGFK